MSKKVVRMTSGQLRYRDRILPAKLDDAKKAQIIERRKQGQTSLEIARAFNTSPSTVMRVCKGV